MIKGPVGTAVTLAITRDGASKDISVTRGNIRTEALYREQAKAREQEESKPEPPPTKTVDADPKIPVSEAYEVRLHRPAKVGDKFRLEVTARRGKPAEKTAVETKKDELDLGFLSEALEELTSRNVPMPELKVNLSADVEVLETDSVGSITKAAFQVNTFLVTRAGVDQPDSNLPLVTARLKDGKVVFEKNGIADNLVEPTMQEALGLAIDIIKTGDATPDQLYGTAEPKQVGDSWAINTRLAAQEFGKFGVFPEASLTGVAGVKGKTRVNTEASSGGKPAHKVDCLQIGVDVNIERFALEIPGFTSKEGQVKIRHIVSVPIDPSLPPLGGVTRILLEHKAFGTSDPNGDPYTLMMKMEEVRETRILLK